MATLPSPESVYDLMDRDAGRIVVNLNKRLAESGAEKLIRDVVRINTRVTGLLEFKPKYIEAIETIFKKAQSEGAKHIKELIWKYHSSDPWGDEAILDMTIIL